MARFTAVPLSATRAAPLRMSEAVAATAWPAVALLGKVLRRCRLVAVAHGQLLHQTVGAPVLGAPAKKATRRSPCGGEKTSNRALAERHGAKASQGQAHQRHRAWLGHVVVCRKSDGQPVDLEGELVVRPDGAEAVVPTVRLVRADQSQKQCRRVGCRRRGGQDIEGAERATRSKNS